MIVDRVAEMIERELATFTSESDIDFEVTIQAVTVGFQQTPLGQAPTMGVIGIVVFVCPSPIMGDWLFAHAPIQPMVNLLVPEFVHRLVAQLVEVIRAERAKAIAPANGHAR